MKLLICTSEPSLSLATSTALSSALLQNASSDQVLLATSFNPSTSGLRDFDMVASVSSQGKAEAAFLAALSTNNVVVSGGKVAIAEPAAPGTSERLQREMLIGGLVEIAVGPSSAGTSGTLPFPAHLHYYPRIFSA